MCTNGYLEEKTAASDAAANPGSELPSAGATEQFRTSPKARFRFRGEPPFFPAPVSGLVGHKTAG